jgi:hypothetical protein
LTEDPSKGAALGTHIESLETGVQDFGPQFIRKDHELSKVASESREYGKLKMALDVCGSMGNVETLAPGLYTHLSYFGSKFKKLHDDL